MVPNIKETSAIERNKFLDLIKLIASKNKQSFKKFAWFWLQQGDQPLLDNFINPEGYPIIVWDADKQSYKLMKEMYTEKAFQKFIENLVLDQEDQEGGGFVKAKKPLAFKNVERWDREDSKEWKEREKVAEEQEKELERLKDAAREAEKKAQAAKEEADRAAQAEAERNKDAEDELIVRLGKYSKDQVEKFRKESEEAEAKWDAEALERDKDVTMKDLQLRTARLVPEIEYQF